MHDASDALVEYFERSGNRPVIVASYPRSGTHLLLDSLRLNFPECRSWKFWGENNDRLYMNLASLGDGRLNRHTALRVARRANRTLFKSHAGADLSWDAGEEQALGLENGNLLRWLHSHATFFYTYRDGRNVLCSFHVLKQAIDPAARVPFSAFLRQRVGGISRVRLWADHVRGWLDDTAAYGVTMEGLLAHPAVVIEGIADKLQAPLDARGPTLPRRTGSFLRGRLNRLLAIHPQSTALIHPDPMPIDWRRTFTRDDRRFFRDEVGDLLIELGYEGSHAWADQGEGDGLDYPIGFFRSPARARARVSAGAGTASHWRRSAGPSLMV